MPPTDSTFVFYRNLRRTYPRIASGSGVWLRDADANEYLDGSGGALVANIGHGVEEVVSAIAEQMRTVAYASGAIFTNDAAETLAADLARLLPEPLRYSYFLCSGSEAIEAAVKLARQVWVERGSPAKWKVITRAPSYHGNTLTALSLSGREHYRRIYEPLLTEFPRVAAPDPYRHPGCEACTGQNLIDEIERLGPETVAAVLVEPIIGSSLGATVPEPEYYRRLRRACDDFDVLLIADEVMAGMGRTGRWCSFEHFDVVPDIAVLGKGISGGYAPLSAVVATDRIVESIAAGSGAFVHAQTYSHTPVICAAGLATIRYLERHRLVERSGEIEPEFFGRLSALESFPMVGDIRGKGLMAGIELVADRDSKRPFPRRERVAERVADAALENGLVVWPNVGHLSNGDGDIIMLGPALSIELGEIDLMVERLGRALERLDAR